MAPSAAETVAILAIATTCAALMLSVALAHRGSNFPPVALMLAAIACVLFRIPSGLGS